MTAFTLLIITAGAFLGGFVNGLAGFGTALVALGIGHLVLIADRQLEDAYAFGQHLLPRLRALPALRRAA